MKIVAHVDAAAEFEAHGAQSSRAAMSRLKERADRTRVTPPSETFEDNYTVTMGDMQIEARYLGSSHSPGDIVIWLPQQSLVIAGDMAFHERL